LPSLLFIALGCVLELGEGGSGEGESCGGGGEGWKVGERWKIIGLDKIRLSKAQILWRMYHKKNIDFVALLWEDFAFQIDSRDLKKQEKMYYPRFTKAIIHHFLSKDKSISMRNIMFMHTAQDDSVLGNLRFVSKDEDTLVYGALIPAVMTNLKIWDSAAYQTYFSFVTGEATPKSKRIYKKTASLIIKTPTTSPKETPSKKKTAPAKKDVSSKKPSRKQSTGVQIRDTPGVFVSKKKAPVTTDKSKGKVPDEPKGKDDDDSVDDDNDDDSDDNDGKNNSDDERAKSDEDENPNLNQNNDDKEEEYDEEYKEEYVHTPENYEFIDDEEEYEELYKDVNVRLKDVEHGEEGKGDEEKTDVDNVPPADIEINSMMNIDVRHEDKYSDTLSPHHTCNGTDTSYLLDGYGVLRFQILLYQLEIHGAGVSHEDANQKFLSSLPSSWSQVALIMRTKLGLDTFSFDDLYNNLIVFKCNVKGTIASSSNTQNVAFVSIDNTSSTNKVSTAYSVSSPFVSKS
nr:hypothetical protein [Tanacetum cinerariifolium]